MVASHLKSCGSWAIYKNRMDTIEWIINTETKTCLENFDVIGDVGEGFLNTISIGRVDLASSFGLTRSEANGEFIFDVSKTFAEKARKMNLKVGIACAGSRVSRLHPTARVLSISPRCPLSVLRSWISCMLDWTRPQAA